MKRQALPTIGTTYIVPLSGGLYAGGQVTHVGVHGKHRLYLGSISLERVFEASAESGQIVEALASGKRWRGRFGPLGFTRSNWRIVGVEEVPTEIRSIPPIYVGTRENAHILSEHDLISLVRPIRLEPDDEALSDSISGDQYIRQVVAKELGVQLDS